MYSRYPIEATMHELHNGTIEMFFEAVETLESIGFNFNESDNGYLYFENDDNGDRIEIDQNLHYQSVELEIRIPGEGDTTEYIFDNFASVRNLDRLEYESIREAIINDY